MSNTAPRIIAYVYMLAYSIIYACLWATIRHLSSDIHPMVLVFFRTFFGLVAILPALLKTPLPALSTGLYPLYIFRGVLNVMSVIAAFFAISLLPLADAVAYSYVAPIFATLLAVFILKEKIGKHRIIAILIAFLGVMVLVRPGFQELNIGILSALGGAGCFAGTLICVKMLTRHETASIVSLMAFIVAFPISLVAALFYWQWPSGEQWIYIVLMGFLAASAHIFLAKAMTKADLSAIMPIDFIRIIFAAIFGITLFGDSFNGFTFLGGGVILASAVYATHRENKIAKAKNA